MEAVVVFIYIFGFVVHFLGMLLYQRFLEQQKIEGGHLGVSMIFGVFWPIMPFFWVLQLFINLLNRDWEGDIKRKIKEVVSD